MIKWLLNNYGSTIFMPFLRQFIPVVFHYNHKYSISILDTTVYVTCSISYMFRLLFSHHWADYTSTPCNYEYLLFVLVYSLMIAKY